MGGIVSWRGVGVSSDMPAPLEDLAQTVEPRVTPIPGYGSYRDNDASGNTDNGGGHVDIYCGDGYGWTESMRKFFVAEGRKRGLMMFPRYRRWWSPVRQKWLTADWATHFHVIKKDTVDLSQGAINQRTQWYNGSNGLAGFWWNGSYRYDPDEWDRTYLRQTWMQFVATHEVKEWWEMADIPAGNLAQIRDAVLGGTVPHPVAGEPAWPLSRAVWSLGVYDIETRKSLASLSKALSDYMAAERLDDQEKDAELARISAELTKVREKLELPPPNPEPVDPAFSLGYDMSGHQTVAQVTEATKTTDFGIIKITEGYGFENSVEDAQVAEVRNANDLVGMYHFAWCDQDPIRELEHFLQFAELRIGELPSLDVENWGTGEKPTPEMKATPWTQRVDYTLKWLEGCEERTGALAPWYANWDWIKGLRTAATIEQWERLCRFPVWIAQPIKLLTSLGQNGVEGIDWRWREPGEFDTISPKAGSTVAPYILLHQYKTKPYDMNWLDGGKQNWLKYAVKKV